jgi:hypothetical protein
MSKALSIMQNVPSVNDRAGKFEATIKRNLQKSELDVLIDKREKIEDKIASLNDFSLNTDLNKGLQPIGREECEARFKQVMLHEYELELLNEEIDAKQEIFNKYFSDNEKA